MNARSHLQFMTSPSPLLPTFKQKIFNQSSGVNVPLIFFSLNFILFVQITHIHTNTFHGHTLFIQKGFRRG